MGWSGMKMNQSEAAFDRCLLASPRGRQHTNCRSIRTLPAACHHLHRLRQQFDLRPQLDSRRSSFHTCRALGLMRTTRSKPNPHSVRASRHTNSPLRCLVD
eukprot:scaffold280027_cov30-Tisochrysis_lutea.AAC.2